MCEKKYILLPVMECWIYEILFLVADCSICFTALTRACVNYKQLDLLSPVFHFWSWQLPSVKIQLILSNGWIYHIMSELCHITGSCIFTMTFMLPLCILAKPFYQTEFRDDKIMVFEDAFITPLHLFKAIYLLTSDNIWGFVLDRMRCLGSNWISKLV